MDTITPMQATKQRINSGEPFVVQLSFGRFMIEPEDSPSGCHLYASRLRSGKLQRIRIGRLGGLGGWDIYDAVRLASGLATPARVVAGS